MSRGFLERVRLELPLDEPLRAGRNYLTLAPDDVREAFKRWIRPEGFVQVVQGPAAR